MSVAPLLIFDLGNVLLRHDNSLLLDNMARGCADPAAVRAAFEREWKMWDDAPDGFAIGVSTVRDFYDRIHAVLGFPHGYDEFERRWSSHFSRDEAMEEFVALLARTYRVVVLSNTNAAHWDYLLREYQVMKTPHRLYASHLLGMVKPAPAIYRHVLDAENYEAADAIFIDDRQANVDGAQGVGMAGLLFTGRAALECDLAALGVKAGSP